MRVPKRIEKAARDIKDPLWTDAERRLSISVSARQWYSTMINKEACPVFEITKELCASLLITDLSRVPTASVVFPFDYFRVFMSGLSNVRSVLVELDPRGVGDKRCCHVLSECPGTGGVGTQVLWFDRNDQDLLQNLATSLSGEGTTGYQVAAILLGTLLYINEQRQLGKLDLSKKTKPKKGQALFHKPKQEWVLGKDVKLPRHVVDEVLNPRPGTSWQATSRWMVRGHWRNQPCGEGRKERRMRWVRPYWKGAEDAPVLLRNYEVGL